MKELQHLLKKNTLSPLDRVRIDILNELEKFRSRNVRKPPLSDHEIQLLSQNIYSKDQYEFDIYRMAVNLERDFRIELSADYYCHKAYFLEASSNLFVYNYKEVYKELFETLHIDTYYQELLGYKRLYEKLSKVFDVEYTSIIDFYLEDYVAFIQSVNTKIKIIESVNKPAESKVFVLQQTPIEGRLYRKFNGYFRRCLGAEWNNT